MRCVLNVTGLQLKNVMQHDAIESLQCQLKLTGEENEFRDRKTEMLIGVTVGQLVYLMFVFHE